MNSRVPLFENTIFDPVATEDDIVNCFRLVLGRYPQASEWQSHSLAVGQPLDSVLRKFVNSAEFDLRWQNLRSKPVARELVDCLRGFRMWVYADDPYIGHPIATLRDYEPHVAAFFCQRVKAGMTVIDIGANMGFFSLTAASLGAHVIAVEPNPSNVNILLDSARENGFTIEVVQGAAYDRWTTLRLFTDGSNGSVMDCPNGGLSVMAFPLKDLLHHRRVDVLKIDAEGSEGRAIRGMLEVVEKWRPSVFSEFTPDTLASVSGLSPSEYLGFFLGRGYQVQVLTRSGPVECSGAEAVMRQYEGSGVDHIDLFFEA